MDLQNLAGASRRKNKLKDRESEIIQWEQLKKKEWERMKKAFSTYETSLQETIYTSLKSQKDKRRKGRVESLFKE